MSSALAGNEKSSATYVTYLSDRTLATRHPMLLGIARFAMRGPFEAAFTAASFALLSLVFAPLLIISGALVALTVLRHGIRQALRVIAYASLAYVLIVTLTGGRFTASAFLPLVWGGPLLAGAVLRHSGNQGAGLAVNAMLVAVYAAIVRLRTGGDVAGFWRERLEALGRSVREEGGAFLRVDEIASVGAVMHMWSLVILCLVLAAMLLLGRSWQDALFNVGAFKPEFRALSVPRVILPLLALVGVAVLSELTQQRVTGLASDFLVLSMVLFGFQGLAVLHHLGIARDFPRWWLVPCYVLLALRPDVIGGLLAVGGIADTVLDFRDQRGTN